MADVEVITGLTWAAGDAQLRVRRDGRPAELVPLAGHAVRYTTGPEQPRMCIGHKPFRDTTVAWEDCDRPPLHDGRTCDRCAANDATFASQLHHAHTRAQGELDAAVVKHLQQPNELYLAAFRDGSVKVGTSTAPRLRTRLTEQGAWMARVVGTATDGFAVRSIEDRVTVAAGLPQSVSIHRKLRGLEQPRPDNELLSEIDLWTNRVHDLIESSADDRLTSMKVDWRNPQADDPMWQNLHPYPLKPESGSHDLELVTACGRAVVARRPGGVDHFVFDLRRLYGVSLVLGEEAPDELAVQDSLF